jgi:hypothetical protein
VVGYHKIKKNGEVSKYFTVPLLTSSRILRRRGRRWRRDTNRIILPAGLDHKLFAAHKE